MSGLIRVTAAAGEEEKGLFKPCCRHTEQAFILGRRKRGGWGVSVTLETRGPADSRPLSSLLKFLWISNSKREREGGRGEVRLGELCADARVSAGKLGRTEPPMRPSKRMERTLMWNPHRVLQRRLRVETDWQFIL
ncbi:hypothetical protein OJAV_G00075150 [Oryzias javanicus]|uniref:Uncharacterized protein n=1 Tax=Oryzias javanicus TaxID=123683 RepID=A0A3S2Q3R1_ORYJA|nr:hypothetical protein OJAV_G00075150 [Oryzias javanicus]